MIFFKIGFLLLSVGYTPKVLKATLSRGSASNAVVWLWAIGITGLISCYFIV